MAPEPSPHPLRIESVGFSPGTGRLVRRTTAVLFDATGTNSKLTSGFDDATTDADAVAFALAMVVESDLEISPFAIVQWSQDLELLVFGDLELHTSLPTAPMITGGDSRTWVQHRVPHHLLASHPSLQVSCGATPEPGTNLRLGIAVSNGFRLNLVLGPADQLAPGAPEQPVVAPSKATVEQPAMVTPPAPPVPPPAPPTPTPTPPMVDPDPAPLPVADVEPDLDRDDTDADPFAVPEPPRPESTPSSGELLEFDPFEPAPAPAPAAVADVVTPANPLPRSEISTWIDDVPDSTTPDSTTPEPDDASESGAASATAEVAAAEVADAPAAESFCVHGHGNPTDSSSCFTCGASIVTASAAGGSLPGVGRLVFDLRDDVIITGAATIGRKPADDGHAELVVIDHPEVSRSHAAISIDGWAVTLTDLESRNGTWVHPPTGEGLRRLDPGERVVLVDGTIVHLGSVDVCFTWIADPDS